MKVNKALAVFMIAAAAFAGRPVHANEIPPSDNSQATSIPFVTGDHCKVPSFVTQSELIIDAKTGNVISENDADRIQHPASLTKMMVAYLAFEAMQLGKLAPQTMLNISHGAAHQYKTNLGLKTGDKISAENALLGMTVHSGNDAAVVLAEFLGGDKENFVALMNAKAKELGMIGTSFVNPTGMPDRFQLTTARDMATMIGALQKDFPEMFAHYFGASQLKYPRYENGKSQQVIYPTLNPLMHWNGINLGKPGFTCSSGWNLAESGERNGEKVIVVIMGEHTESNLEAHMKEALNMAYASLQPQEKIVVATAQRPMVHSMSYHRPRRANQLH